MMDTEKRQDTLRKIKEVAAECVLMETKQYEDFKTGATQACDEKAKPFLCRVLSFIDMKREKVPVLIAELSFYDTVEGCAFANRDKELHNAVKEVFDRLPYEDKQSLCFVPENGRFLARMQLWGRELELALPPRLSHKAMGAILHQLVKIKLNQAKAVGVCQQK